MTTGSKLSKSNRNLGTHVEGSEAVPTEDVFAPLAHHLSAAFVLLDRDGAHRAALDEVRVEGDAGRGAGLGTWPTRVPLTSAQRTEMGRTGGAVHLVGRRRR